MSLQKLKLFRSISREHFVGCEDSCILIELLMLFISPWEESEDAWSFEYLIALNANSFVPKILNYFRERIS